MIGVDGEPDENPLSRASPYGEQVSWQAATVRLRPLRLLLSWVIAAASVWAAAALVPGVALERTDAAFAVAALIAVLNVLLPPILAALRLPFMLVAGFLLVLVADALLLVLAHELLGDDIHVDSFGGDVRRRRCRSRPCPPRSACAPVRRTGRRGRRTDAAAHRAGCACGRRRRAAAVAGGARTRSMGALDR